mmetsp:Transcript_146300/g.364842  ORF Transcript_146300/g.364842 Transcript_146300/m.364842 type:complete len:315 (-) Transcript_146300:672-1616(-)
MLPGFKSRCKIGGFWPCKYCIPRATSTKTLCSWQICLLFFAYSMHASSKAPLFLRFFTYLPKSPLSIHSSTKHKIGSVPSRIAVTPWKSTMFGCRMRLKRRISLSKVCACEDLIFTSPNVPPIFFGIFTATSVLSSRAARRTSPKPPVRVGAKSAKEMDSLGMTQCSLRPMVTISVRSISLKISAVKAVLENSFGCFSLGGGDEDPPCAVELVVWVPRVVLVSAAVAAAALSVAACRALAASFSRCCASWAAFASACTRRRRRKIITLTKMQKPMSSTATTTTMSSRSLALLSSSSPSALASFCSTHTPASSCA